jgi:hypothetical protein
VGGGGCQGQHTSLNTVMVQYQALFVSPINPFRMGSGIWWPRSRHICFGPSLNIYFKNSVKYFIFVVFFKLLQG